MPVQIPSALLQSLAEVKDFNKEAFENIHASGKQVTSVRLNNSKLSVSEVPSFGGDLVEAVPWTEFGYYLSSRPSFTFDPLFHAGCYYVQEASSMFLEQALKQTVDLSKPLKVLDLCAAPGGKSTHIQSLISKDSLLVSNEVIRSRANILKDNIIKWGCENVVVANNDPADFVRLENYFDIIVVDAPCSGSGLFRRDPQAIDEWSENNVQLCSQRQQRILADVWPALKKDGILIYSTCSYSKDEDEDIMDWISSKLEIGNKKLEIRKEWGITETVSAAGNTGYRFWPDKVKGEGFFLSVFRKTAGDEAANFKSKKSISTLTKKEEELVTPWAKTEGFRLVKNQNNVYAWPEKHFEDFNFLLQQLKVVYSGIAVGEMMKNKLVPTHALAMSNICNGSLHREKLGYDAAIKYLQRRDPEIITDYRGWTLASYQGHFLGWMNILPGRVNNYYPKELRILKERADG